MKDWKPLNGIVETAKAMMAGMEIEVFHDALGWLPWVATTWYANSSYRARPRKPEPKEQIQPTTKRVKSLCWRDSVDGELKWTDEGINKEGRWKRFPIGDLEGDVEI